LNIYLKGKILYILKIHLCIVSLYQHKHTHTTRNIITITETGVCDLALSFGEGSDGDKDKRMSRPFGVAYNEDMTLEEAEELALSTLKQVMEEKISTDNVELARVTKEKGYHSATTEEVGAVLERL
jgi:20S proteasome subunit alpha 5